MHETIHTTTIASTMIETGGPHESLEETSYSMEQGTTKETSGRNEDANQNTKDSEGDQMLTEEEIEAFIQSEQIAASEGNNADCNSRYTAQLGMQFDTTSSTSIDS